MPLSTSLLLSRPSSLWRRSPSRPYQLACMAATVVGWLMTAGVHSTVWILAISAAVISRARWKSSSSDQAGYASCNASQMALCSRRKTRCIMARPSQKPGTPAGSFSGASGNSGPSGTRSLPPRPVRSDRCPAGSLPYSWEASHQGELSLRKVGGRPSSLAGRVGSGIVRGTTMGGAGHGSPSASSMCQGRSMVPCPWLAQSLIMNCSQAATRVLTDSAGTNVRRVSRAAAPFTSRIPARAQRAAVRASISAPLPGGHAGALRPCFRRYGKRFRCARREETTCSGMRSRDSTAALGARTMGVRDKPAKGKPVKGG